MHANLPRQQRGILLAVLSFALASALTARVPSGWQTLSPGMDLKYVSATKQSSNGELPHRHPAH